MTNTMAEVARILAEAAPCTWSIHEPEHPYSDSCLYRRHDKGHGACWDTAYAQAAALANAGLFQETRPVPDPNCSCAACDPGAFPGYGFIPSRLSVCPNCGNKRCPKAANHSRWRCSGSNKPNQTGVPA